MPLDLLALLRPDTSDTSDAADDLDATADPGPPGPPAQPPAAPAVRRLTTAGDDVTRLLDALSDVALLTQAQVRDLAHRAEVGVLAQERLASGPRDAAEAEDLAVLVRAGRAAYERLVLSNVRLVVSVVRQLPDSGVATGDLVQEGILGLVRAVQKYDHRRGFAFSTYARWWIRHAVTQARADQARAVRVPVHAHSDALVCVRERARQHGRLGREPTLDELAAATGHDAETVRLLLRTVDGRAHSLDVVPEDSPGLLETLSTPTADPVEQVAAQDRRLDLQHALAVLPPDERAVLVALSGWPDGEPRSRRAVADALGVSREQVARLAQRACERMRGVPEVARWSDAS